jgi:hypothetical protein
MTDEQIKQNALAYATENYGEYDEHDYTDHSGSNMCHAVSEKAYIAGYHSRDEEIEKIKEGKCSLRRSLHRRISALVKEIDGLEDELKQLRNPWISVEERLPEEHSRVLIMFCNGTVTYNDYIGVGDINYMKAHSEIITHWMPIPQLKKGGEK